MKKLMLLITPIGIALLIFNKSIAQSIDEKVTQKFTELKAKGIDTMVCYYSECIGYVRTYDFDVINNKDTCLINTTQYVIWNEGSQSYIQKFDDCITYIPEKITRYFLSFLNNNLQKIKKDTIDYPHYDVMKNGKKTEYWTIVDHSCHYYFKIFSGKNVFTKSIDDFALDTKYIDKKHLNKNYYRNQHSSLKYLKDIMRKNLEA